MSVEISMSPRLENNLKRLPMEAGRSVILAAVTDLKTQAQFHASGRPGPRVVSDQLRSTISWEIKPSGLEGRVGPHVAYGEPVEFGHMTRPRVKSKPLHPGHMTPAYPFLRPAMVSTATRFPSLSFEMKRDFEGKNW